VNEKPRILVTYGCHLGEDFAKEVGLEFEKLNLENIIVRGLEGERPRKPNEDIFAEWRRSHSDWKKGKIVYPEDIALIRRKVGARYGIDLHDNLPSREWVLQNLEDPAVSGEMGLKYELVGHMGYEKAKRLVLGFKKEWNRTRGTKEISESSSFACECYHLTYHMRRSCRANIIGLEYSVALSDITIKDGVNFLKKLVEYLQSYG